MATEALCLHSLHIYQLCFVLPHIYVVFHTGILPMQITWPRPPVGRFGHDLITARQQETWTYSCETCARLGLFTFCSVHFNKSTFIVNRPDVRRFIAWIVSADWTPLYGWICFTTDSKHIFCVTSKSIILYLQLRINWRTASKLIQFELLLTCN